MSFLDTVPAAIQRLEGRGPWARFRVTEPRQRVAMLREVKRGDVPLTLGSADGPTLPALLWMRILIWLNLCCARLPRKVTPPPPPFKPKRFRTWLPVAICWVAPKRALVKPPRLRSP